MAAGLATLRHLKANPGIYQALAASTAGLADSVTRHIAAKGYPAVVNHFGSMITVFFTPGPVKGWADASKCDTAAFGRYFHAMLAEGCHLPPAQYEAWFLSAAMKPEHFEHLAAATNRSLDAVFAG
jgi:glutamate-1-semialdehyde 2,1-aminomutase